MQVDAAIKENVLAQAVESSGLGSTSTINTANGTKKKACGKRKAQDKNYDKNQQIFEKKQVPNPEEKATDTEAAAAKTLPKTNAILVGATKR